MTDRENREHRYIYGEIKYGRKEFYLKVSCGQTDIQSFKIHLFPNRQCLQIFCDPIWFKFSKGNTSWKVSDITYYWEVFFPVHPSQRVQIYWCPERKFSKENPDNLVRESVKRVLTTPAPILFFVSKQKTKNKKICWVGSYKVCFSLSNQT